MNTAKTWLKKAIVFLVVAAMAITLFPFTGLKSVTKAEDGPNSLFAETEKYQATVSFGDDAGIPAGAYLVLTEFEEGSSEYAEAKETLIQEDNGLDEGNFGMAAFDLTIYDADGVSFEPSAPVQVNIQMKELPEGVDPEALEDSLTVQHLDESSGEIAVETVATTDEDEAGEIVVSEDTAEAEFTVDSFSTFTITWSNAATTNNNTELRLRNGNNTRGQATFNYVDSNGIALTRPTGVGGNTDITINTNYPEDYEVIISSDNVARAISGREYQRAYIVVNGAEQEVTRLLFTRTGNNSWQIDYYNGETFVTTASGNNVGGNWRYPVYLQYSGEAPSAEVTLHLVDAKGNPLSGFTYNGTTLDDAASFPLSEVLPNNGDTLNLTTAFTKEGYTFDNSFVNFRNGDSGGDVIGNMLRRNNNIPQYRTNPADANNYTNIENGTNIYLVYSKVPSGSGGSGGGGDDDTPDLGEIGNSKAVNSNKDGTYDVALTVSGSAQHKTEETDINVVFVIDCSNSMTMWGRTRLADTKEAVKNMAEELLKNNTTSNPDAIELSVVAFNATAWNVPLGTDDTNYWTTDYDTFADAIGTGNTSGITSSSGTNWEEALQKAISVDKGDGDATYVIFFTDGDPTEYAGHNTSANTAYETNYWPARDEARDIVNSGKVLYGIYAYGEATGTHYLEPLVSYAYNGSSSGKYFDASDTEDVQEALEAILDEINMNFAYANVSIDDGVTGLSSTTLIGTDTSSLTYKITYKDYTGAGATDFTVKTVNATVNSNGTLSIPAVTYGVLDSEETAGWKKITTSPVTINGVTFTDSGVSSGKTVSWQMKKSDGTVYMLEDGWTYGINFTVWPSQEAYDLVAALNNGVVKWGDDYKYTTASGTTATISFDTYKEQINKNGNTYSLKTNTDCQVTYQQVTVTTDSEGHSTYEYGEEKHVQVKADPEGEMGLDSTTMNVRKAFAHDINMQDPYTSIEFYLLEDGKYYQNDGTLSETLDENTFKLPVNAGNSWTNSVFIAPGVMKDGEVLETGHKYSLDEKILVGNEYEYEFTPQTVRPMVINGTLTYLVLVDDYNPAPSGATTYTIDDEVYYVQQIAEGANGELVGTNRKTAELDITKMIVDNTGNFTEAQLDAETFTYRVTLTVPKDGDISGITAYEYVPRTDHDEPGTYPAPTPTNPDATVDRFYVFGYQASEKSTIQGIASDVSRFNQKIFGAYTVTTSTANRQMTDMFVVNDDGTKTATIDITLKRNEIIRFTNLPADTQYTIVEMYNDYRQADPSRDRDAAGDEPKPANIADQGYTTTVATKSRNPVTDTVRTGSVTGTTVTGTIDYLDVRYYNQFTNTLDDVIDVELTGTKHLEGYEWSGERYYFNLSTEEEGTPMPPTAGTLGRTRFYLSEASGTADKSYSFGRIRFTEPGTYTYKIAEDNAGTRQTIDGKSILFDGSKTVTIVIKENDGKLYVDSVTGDDDDTTWDATTLTANTTITNTYETTTVTATKVWDDNDNQDGKRNDVTFLLQKNGTTVQGSGQTIAATATDDDLTVSWTNLPVYEGTQKITYTVIEDGAVNGKITMKDGAEYTVTTTSATENSFTIKNSYIPETTAVTAKKVWNDSNNIWEVRPPSINVQLMADGIASGDPATLNEGNEWTYTWEDLPKYNNGEEIEYTADETAVPAGYDKTGPVKSTAEDGTITFTVTNTYNPTPVKAEPSVQKIIENYPDLYNNGDFTFTIVATNPADAPMPDEDHRSITNSADYELEGKTGIYGFGEITFTKPGTYTYKVTEEGDVDGVINDEAAETGKVITFVVEDDGTGKLVVSPQGSTTQVSFTNTYNASGVATITVTKAITGADWPKVDGEAKVLTFTLTGEGNPMPEKTTATLDAVGSVSFGPITYSLDDVGPEYIYTITEDGFGDGWTGSPDSITAKVKVTDNGDGTLATEVTYDPANATITNTYKAKGEATIEATKAISGAAWPEDGTITFTLAGTGDAPMPAKGGETRTLTEAGTATFGKITYTEADAGKTYTYTITEDGFGKGWTGSPTSITATVKVTDNGDGTLKTEVTYDPADKTITNTYEAEGEAVLQVTKALEGAGWPEGKTLTFTLAGEGGTLPSTKTATLRAEGTATFGAITYTEADAGKTYTYTITEDGFGKGWTGSPEKITATVKVTDNGDGTLKTEVTYDPADETITNTYKAEGEAELQVTKALEGAGWPEGKTLTFTLAGQGGTLPSTKTATLRAEGTATFGAITYTEADAGKTYTYTITEDGFGKGWTGSPEKITATVKVTDNGDGTLKTEVTYDPADKTITNTYKAEGKATIEATKVISGAAWPKDGTITFTLAGTEGAPMPAKGGETRTLTEAGTATFGEINYTEADAGKTYTYTITEDGFGGAWTGSPEKITATVKVTDNGDGTLKTEVTYDPANKTITNTYKAEGEATLKVKKAVEGAEWPEGKTLTFTLAGEGGTLPATKTATLTAPGTATFGKITYTEADAGKTYTYTITEDGFGKGWTGSPTSITAKVKVTDNGDGTLATEVTYTPENATITNTYKAEGEATIEVAKKLLGAEWPTGKKLTFTLAGQGGTLPATKTATLTAPGTATFGKITYTEADAGKTYTYTITEDGFGEGWRGTPEKITATVKVTDNGDGTLKTEVSYDPADQTFTNIVLIDIPVEKEWVDFNNRYNLRPGTITLNLYSDKSEDPTKPIDTAKVSTGSDGSWKHTFTQLPSYTDAGEKITYHVDEEAVDNYQGVVSGSMDTGFLITNTLKTGDLLITKDLTEYNNFINETVEATPDKVTFVYEITATFGESTTPIYHDYAALTFDGSATTNIIELKDKLPVGAKVTVKEVYTGAGYIAEEASGSGEATVEGKDEVKDLEITAGTTDIATANFKNAYDDRIPGGYGVVNQYTKDSNGNWTGKDIGDNHRVPAPVVQ